MAASHDLGRRLKAALVLADRTASDLASDVGLSAATLGRLMQGKRAPRVGELEAIARALDVPEWFLVDGFDGDAGASLELADLPDLVRRAVLEAITGPEVREALRSGLAELARADTEGRRRAIARDEPA